MLKDWLILKTVATQDERKNKRIAHGDGGLGTVEYYESLAGMISDLNQAGLITLGGSVRYDAGVAAGIKCLVTADDYGIIAIQYPGGVRIIVPDTVMLRSFRLKGDSSYLSGNELEISIYGGYGTSTLLQTYNTEDDNSYHPFLSLVSRNQLMPTDPFVQRPHDAGGYEVFHKPITTPGTCVSQITGVTGDWEVFGQL